MYYMGIDTSCYTSSVAIVDNMETIIFDGRIMLNVPQGDRGLRQSDAVFQHTSNISRLCQEAMDKIDPKALQCITVSSKPRDVEGSYMPVFTTGTNAGQIISSCLQIPMIHTSHQQGHITAGAWSINRAMKEPYLVYHISGGTTELLLVDADKRITEVGGSEDLKAGQFIDRIGVAMGLGFPCGKEMDKLSGTYAESVLQLPISVKGSCLSFSGPESHVQRMLKERTVMDEDFKAQISRSVFHCIGMALEKTILNASAEHGAKDVLVVGGVAANSMIRDILTKSTKMRKMCINVNISEPKYSSDNAVGAAVFGKRMFEGNGGQNEQS